MSRFYFSQSIIFLLLIYSSVNAVGAGPSHEPNVKSSSSANEESLSREPESKERNPHEECCYGREGKLSRLESLAEQPGFESRREEIKALVDSARRGDLSQADRTWLHETLNQFFSSNSNSPEARPNPSDLNNGLLAVPITARPVTAGPGVSSSNSSTSFNPSLPFNSPAPIVSGTDRGSSQKAHETAVGVVGAISGPGLAPVGGVIAPVLASGATGLLPRDGGEDTRKPNMNEGTNPPPGATHVPVAKSPDSKPASVPQISVVKPTPSPVSNGPEVPIAVNTSPDSKPSFVPQTPVVTPTPGPTPTGPAAPIAVNNSSDSKPPVVPPTPTERLKPPTSTPNITPPATLSTALERGLSAPDFSFALTQTFNFNRPNSVLENKKELSPIGPLPLPNFYATALPVAPLKAETPALPVVNPPPNFTPDAIKKPEVATAQAPGVQGLKIEKPSVSEPAKPTPVLEPLALTKLSGGIPGPVPVAPVTANTNISPLITQSNIPQIPSIPTVVLPVLPVANTTIEPQNNREISSLQIQQPNPSKPLGTSGSSGSGSSIISNSSISNTTEPSAGKEIRASLSTYSGLFDEIRSILAAKRSTSTMEAVSMDQEAPAEPTRQLSSMEFAPTPALEPTLWKVVFLEKSGKTLSWVNVMIAFGSTLLLIWILLMRLKREAKASEASQSALLSIRKNDGD